MILKNSLYYMNDAERAELRGILQECVEHKREYVRDNAQLQRQIIDAHNDAIVHSALMAEEVGRTTARQHMKQVQHFTRKNLHSYGDWVIMQYDYLEKLAHTQDRLRAFISDMDTAYGDISYADHFAWRDRRESNASLAGSGKLLREFLQQDLHTYTSERLAFESHLATQLRTVEDQFKVVMEKLVMSKEPDANATKAQLETLSKNQQKLDHLMTEQQKDMAFIIDGFEDDFLKEFAALALEKPGRGRAR